MTFFPDPIKPSEGRQEDRYKVNPTEPDPHKKDAFNFQNQREEKKWKVSAVFLNFLRHLTRLFNGKKGTEGRQICLSGFSENLERFKALLIELQEMDQSENGPFYEALSIAWVRLLQEAQVLSHTKQKTDLKGFFSLIEEIRHFPREKEHQLGYYLSHYAGNDWLPFPFREILKNLHQDYRVNRETSLLYQWTQKIETLL